MRLITEGDSDYEYLLIHDFTDLMKYFEIALDKRGKETSQAWFDLKDNKFNYMTAKTPVETQAAMQVMMLKEGTQLSMVEFCSAMDKMYMGKFDGMKSMLDNGKQVRVNQVGGYCYADLMNVEEHRDCNRNDLLKFIYNGKVPLILKEEE